ncbi:hypothetical protein [Papillibacter cinnamivorans]|uniref:hypothetical protein n=1 Tax=Papillibacter cinnamivorans TaxID=100176 RepID=UPI001A9A6834|nr:hypothetical protein [Papillibacter cinnamivorans]
MQATMVPEQQDMLSAADVLPSVSPSDDVSEYNPDKSTSLLKVACDALEYIKAGDYESLAEMIHPVDGVIFVPYSTVNLSGNLRFSAKEIASLDTDTAKYTWGITNGEGKPIELTMAEYFKTYVFNADYTQAPMIGINQILQYGNSLENVEEIFPDADFVEFHFPGLQEEYDGYDWCSLKLVFEMYNSQPKIVAIIHSQWTI